jgi:hypothetical protein
MFTGPQHTLTLRRNLRFPQTTPTDGELQFTLSDVLKVPPIPSTATWRKFSANSAAQITSETR